MIYQIRLRPEILDDATEAFHWYDEQARGMGDEFLQAFYAAIDCIQQQPQLFRKAYGASRRLYLRRFPYFLYYQVEQQTVVFLLLFHCSKDPRRIRRALGERK